MKTKKLIELEQEYRLEEIKLTEESKMRLIEAEKKPSWKLKDCITTMRLAR